MFTIFFGSLNFLTTQVFFLDSVCLLFNPEMSLLQEEVPASEPGMSYTC